MKRFICIHGHFYQPPRENPWLEVVESQDSAYPYHDWNQRITAECYAPNAASRILDQEKKIVEIVNNYANISFNFGPTLLSWLEKNDQEVYQAILEADRQSIKLFSGHGSALAQVYNHIIMPLANRRDKETQIIWGIKDFEYRFRRKPEGMWLSETAVDLETLELLALHGIRFTILAPRQAKRVRKINTKNWREVGGGKINPKTPYLCNLPSGKSIILFFYDGPISQQVAFGGLLESGEKFAGKLVSAFDEKLGGEQMVHVATDGETYGHHHRYGEMALSFCLHHMRKTGIAEIVIYAEYLDKVATDYEVEIYENSSWSCVHGVERWRSNCGCNSGANPGWQQKWRAPLRQAMDWLRDNLIKIYEEQMAPFFSDPWQVRNDYIEIILNRTEEKTVGFLSHRAGRGLGLDEQVKIRKLLEMQTHAMLMYTSCGWFFDDISGIETVQVILYAARAIQLAREISGLDFEAEFVKRLAEAPGNTPHYENGAVVYDKIVKNQSLDLLRVGAHYAISSLFKDYAQESTLFCFKAQSEFFERHAKDSKKLAIGRAKLSSNITGEQQKISFAVVHDGGKNIIGGIRKFNGDVDFNGLYQEIKTAFFDRSFEEVIPLIDKYFGEHSYSLWHLFRDEQRKILGQVVKPGMEEIEVTLRRIFKKHYETMRSMNKLRIPLPRALYTTARFVFNQDLRNILEQEELDLKKLEELVTQVKEWPLKFDKKTLGFDAGLALDKIMARLENSPSNLELLAAANTALKCFNDPALQLELNLWKAQNLFFKTGRLYYSEMENKSAKGDEAAKKWLELFNQLGEYLRVRIK
jgi:alpha-amylase/alpha-mannosidase (GH57 family)